LSDVLAETLAWLRAPLFVDRAEAGRLLAAEVERRGIGDPVVIGLARGGVQVASAVADALGAPLDVVAVRKVGHPWQPEYALGAVTPGHDGVYVRGQEELGAGELAAIVAKARKEAEELDRRFHEDRPAVELTGRTALLVDDGLATGATMVAAARWARARGAARVAVAVPVAAAQSLGVIEREGDEVICLHAIQDFFAVGVWYGSFEQVGDEEVVKLLEEART
jgi:predicted phosphoribosyltransferase